MIEIERTPDEGDIWRLVYRGREVGLVFPPDGHDRRYAVFALNQRGQEIQVGHYRTAVAAEQAGEFYADEIIQISEEER